MYRAASLPHGKLEGRHADLSSSLLLYARTARQLSMSSGKISKRTDGHDAMIVWEFCYRIVNQFIMPRLATIIPLCQSFHPAGRHRMHGGMARPHHRST
jgi:hypothetical protein